MTRRLEHHMTKCVWIAHTVLRDCEIVPYTGDVAYVAFTMPDVERLF